MSDKARKLYPLTVTISPGEQPSAAKLTALSTQAKAASDKLEFMVGDLWNAAGDAILSPPGDITANALHIPNLARAVGRMSLLNSFLPTPISTSTFYVDSKPGTQYVGQNRAFLTYNPSETPGVGTMILTGTVTPLVQIQFKTTPEEIVATGDWCIDGFGKLYTFDPIPAGLQVEYKPFIQPIINGSLDNFEAGWNVIPDPSTWGSNYDGLKISFANNTDATNGYHIWMPPRMPLTGTRYLNSTPDATGNNIQSTPDAGTFRVFQDSAVNAAIANGNHYRYNLPDAITGGAANSQLPTGFLYLWDEEFGTIIEGAAYYTPANTAHSKFKVRAVGSDLANVFGTSIGSIITDDSTQLPADYKSRFKLIGVGTSLAKAVEQLIKFAANHNHQIAGGGTPIRHSDLDGLVTPSDGDDYPGTVPSFRETNWGNDDHPQYLHRAGSTSSDSSWRDEYDNCMFNQFIVSNSFDSSIGIGLFANSSYMSIGSLNSALLISSSQLGNASAPALIQMGEGTIPGDWLVDNTNQDTISIRGGGSTGVAQILNGQVQRLYLAPDTSFDRAPCYLDWDDDDEILFLTGTTGFSTFSAPQLSADVAIDAPLVRAGTAFRYQTPLTQYKTIDPTDFIPYIGTPADVFLYFTAMVITNQDPAATVSLSCMVDLPHGVTVNSAMTFNHLSAGNTVTGVNLQFLAFPKPTSSGYSASPVPIILFNVTGGIPHTTDLTTGNYALTHTIDNSFAGYRYVLVLTMPPSVGGNNSDFFGGTLSYLITDVNN